MKKKASYDLGNKGLYFLVVCFVVAIMFLIASNSVNKLNTRTFQAASKLSDISILTKVTTCFSKELDGRIYFGEIDKEKFTEENLKECLEGDPFLLTRGISVQIGETILQLREPDQFVEEYERNVLLNGEIKILKIKVEPSADFKEGPN